MSPYVYAENNPISNADPSGLAPQIPNSTKKEDILEFAKAIEEISKDPAAYADFLAVPDSYNLVSGNPGVHGGVKDDWAVTNADASKIVINVEKILAAGPAERTVADTMVHENEHTTPANRADHNKVTREFVPNTKQIEFRRNTGLGVGPAFMQTKAGTLAPYYSQMRDLIMKSGKTWKK